VTVVVRQPVHLPGAEQLGAGALGLGIRQPGREPAAFFQDDLAYVGGIHRHPAVAVQVELGAAVLGLGDVPALAEALELRGVRAARAVYVARRDLHGPREADEERVEIGALAAEVARLEHRLDVAQPAAATFGSRNVFSTIHS